MNNEDFFKYFPTIGVGTSTDNMSVSLNYNNLPSNVQQKFENYDSNIGKLQKKYRKAKTK